MRYPVMEDAQTIFSLYAQDHDVVRFLSWKAHESIDETKAFLSQCIEKLPDQQDINWVIEDKTTRSLFGMIALRMHDFSAGAGYVLAKPYWGQGYMTEALCNVRDVVMALPQIYRFWIFCDVDNKASARVIEKAGLTKEGCMRRFFVHPNIDDRPRDCFCFSIVK